MTDKHIVKYNGIGCGYIAMHGIKDIPNGPAQKISTDADPRYFGGSLCSYIIKLVFIGAYWPNIAKNRMTYWRIGYSGPM